MRVRSVVSEAWKISRSSIDYWLLAFVTSLLTAFGSIAYSPFITLIFRNSASSPSSHSNAPIYLLILIAWGAIVVAIFSQAALIQAVAAKITDDEDVNIKMRLRYMVGEWKRLLLFFIIFAVPSFIFMVSLLGVTNSMFGSLATDAGAGDFPAASFVLMPLLLCGFAPVMIALGVLRPFAFSALVIEKLDVGDSIKRGFEIARLNFGAFIRFALLMAAILIVPLILIQRLIAPIRAAVSAPVQLAAQACLEQNTDPSAAIDCVFAVNGSLHATLAQLLPMVIQSVPGSFIFLLSSAAFTVFYCKILQATHPSPSPVETCTWHDARERLVSKIDPEYRFDAHVSDDDGLMTAHLEWRQQRVTDPTHRLPLTAAADELLCVRPAIDLVIAEILDEENTVQGIGMWMRSAMEARAIDEFVCEQVE